MTGLERFVEAKRPEIKALESMSDEEFRPWPGKRPSFSRALEGRGEGPLAVIAEYRDWQQIQTPALRKIIQDNVFMAEPVRKWETRGHRREKYVIIALNVPEQNRRKITIFQ